MKSRIATPDRVRERPPPDGWVDLQVNGYLGVNFSSTALTLDGVRTVTGALGARGTVAFCPTVATASWATYEHVLPLLGRACALPEFAGRLLGLHLEGPFISAEDGAVGAHPKGLVQPPSRETFDRFYELAEGRIRLVTLAPELPGALDLISHAVGRGVRVAIGHTLAGDEAVQAAVLAGATLSTHLGNGCPNLIHRHHNPLWAQLDADLTAMIIADGHHLPDSLIRVILRAKGPERVIATSDAAPIAGLAPGVYEFLGTRVQMDASGLIRNLNAPTLAGSSATLAMCLAHLDALGCLTREQWRALGFDNPLAALGLGPDALPAGARAPVRP